MSLNLYFKTDKFRTNKSLALYVYDELESFGFSLKKPENDDYMYSIEASMEGEVIYFYMGKNDEDSQPPLWQIWPEQSIPIFKRIFGKPNREPEAKAKSALEVIVNKIEGVSSVEWGI